MRRYWIDRWFIQFFLNEFNLINYCDVYNPLTWLLPNVQVELYRRDAEERARQELQEKLDQVNLFLQVGALAQS